MTEQDRYPYFIAAGFISAAAVFVFLFFFTAPYGRHIRKGWGPTVPNRLGWILMETPAVLAILYFCLSERSSNLGAVWIFLVLWQTHYLYRTYVFPFMLRDNGKRMPIMIVLSGMGFNLFNGYVNGRYLAWAADTYTMDWLGDPRFIVGTLIFYIGLKINMQSDRILINLRGDGSTGYKIPQGGLYRWISCPNYFGELLEWTGWAILTWSVPGLLFAVWTAANLVPRAVSNHRWYQNKFPDYPTQRRAVIPFVL